MRKKLLVALVGLSLALIAGTGNAQTEVGVRFGIRPTLAYEDRPETFSYFSHELAPGAVLADEALVMNSGDVPVTLTLYAADGFTAINTGTAFTKRYQEATGVTRGVNRWLFFSVTEIALEPGEEMVVPFSITVPADATPGHHVAGLVVQAPPRKEAVPGGGEGQFGAIVIQQAAVAVVIDVPGYHFAGLEITGTCLKIQGEIGATFEIDVRSRGNIIVKGGGSLSIMDRNAEELASVPLKMGAVLPGDATTFQVTHPVNLADGDYLLSVVLDYGGRAQNFKGNTAVLNGVEMKVKDGQPDVGCDPEEEEAAAPPFSITNIVPALGEGGPAFVRYAAYAAPFVALALALLLLIIWRKRRKRGASQPAPQARPSGSAGGAPGEASPDNAPSRQIAAGADEGPFFKKVVPSRSSEEDAGDPAAEGADDGPFASKVVPSPRSGQDAGDLPAAGADEVPSFSKVIPSQRSGQDDGDLPAAGADEGPFSSKVVPSPRLGDDAGDLPTFLIRQLQSGTEPSVPTPSEEATDAPPSQQTERGEQPEDGRAA